ncbi:hybrid sensor histidine kinase/response regulator transcription factor [Nibrella saemangeumensis]|uniref:histidine kinase n=1 Tax=Nibrella saemangeumensis TaxID=1084526 RepID=A0ABP8M9P0_9BACT
MKSASFALILLVCCWTLVSAQQYTASVKHYGPEQGLAHREVNAIFQDRQGFMWFGTRFGLCRFDGLRFTTYTKEKHGLVFDDIQAIAEDADGLLWLMGPYGQPQVMLFDPQTGAAVSFEEKFKKKLPFRYDKGAIPEWGIASENGTVFLSIHQPALLVSYHPRSGLRFTDFPQFKRLRLERVTSHNTVWAVADDNQLVELSVDGRVLHRFLYDGYIVRACLGQQHAGTEFFYIAYKGYTFPYSSLHSITEQGEHREWPPHMLNTMLQDRLPVCVTMGQDDLLWDGIHLQHPKKGIILDITGQLNGEPVTNRSFYRDRYGQFWLGTSFGVYQVRLIQHHFHRLFFEPSSKGDRMAAIRGIEVIGDQVYANQEKFGLYTCNRLGGATKALFEKATFASMFGLSRDRRGRLYAGADIKLFRYDQLPSKATILSDMAGLSIWAFHQYSDEQMLAGGLPGLWTVDLTRGQVSRFARYNQFPELDQAHVLHIGTDRQGIIWICANSGLYTFDPDKGITARYWSGGKGPFYLPADNVQHFYQDVQGVYWLATANSGLIRWDRRQQQYRQFRRSEGLSNDNIYAVYPDKRDHLWLSSDFGIMQFDPTRLTIRAYFVEDGITHNEFNRIAHFQEPSGRIYFGGLNGITAFDPQDFFHTPTVTRSPLRITSFRQFDPSTKTIVDKTDDVLKNGVITIPPDERSSVLEFAMLNYANAEKNVYAYQFRDIDTSWLYQSEAALPLSSLPYGEHQLLIRAQAANGQWAANTLALTVTVRRPVYLRTWFVLSMILLAGAGSWAWARWRVWHHRMEQSRLETEIRQATALIAQQAQALQQLNETKSRFFANISHEFRTPLTVILGMASELKDKPDQSAGTLQQAARLIQQNGTNLLRLINQILDLSKLEAGEMHLHPVRADLISFTRYVGESFHSLAKAKDIQLHFLSDTETCDADFDKEKLQDIIANLLSNALKFTPAGGHVYCQLQVLDRWQSLSPKGYQEELIPTEHLDDPWIQMTVSDTGPGIEPASLPKVFDRFYQAGPPQAGPRMAENQPVSEADPGLAGGTGIGLSLVRELVLLMRGGLAVRNRPKQGAEFVVCLPLTRQAASAEGILPAPVLVSPDRSDLAQPAPAEAGHKPVLLLVEDNEDVATYILTCVEADYRVIRAENGQVGIDTALDQMPDLILSDVMMPVKDGFALCDTLKNDERTSHISIVLLTARAAVSDRLTGLRRGADAYLVKPFQREELLLVLGNLLQTRRVLQLHYSQLALGSVGKNPVPVPPADSVEDQFLIRLRDVIEPQLGNTELSVDDICQLIGMSRTTLHMKLTALTGMPVRLYLRRLRLRKAQELLTNSPLNISEVAYASGFADPRYFSRVFAEEFGVTPGNFRLSGRD